MKSHINNKSLIRTIIAFTLVFSMILSPLSQVKVSAKKKSPKILIAYFSVTGNTASAVKKVKKATRGTVFRINPKVPYSKEDIDYNVDDCRANVEQNDDLARPEIKNKVKKMKKYDVIILAYPIWWRMSYNKDKSEETQYLQGVQDWFSPYYFAA